MRKRVDTLAGSLELLILKALSREPNHGFGITLYLQTASDGYVQVEEGSLYPALHRLEREGLLHGEWRSTPNGRRARYYALTATGRDRLSDSEEQWHRLTQGIAKILRFA